MTFDTLAPTYDHDFSAQPFAQALRVRVHERLAEHFHAGDHVLELACGTGEDALALAQRGVKITATDSSPAMLEIARAKLHDHANAQVEPLNLAHLPPKDDRRFAGAFSNFGGLNCLSDWSPLARWLADHVTTGGVVAFGVMSPFCLWEMTWGALHLNFKRAFRRWRPATFQPDPAQPPINIHYPTVRRLTRDFAPCFTRVSVEPLGLAIPPSELFAAFAARPRWRDRLIALDRRLTLSPLALLADHYWIALRRV